MLINQLTDAQLCELYLKKIENAESSGKEFALSFNEFRSLYRRSTCYYSGIKLTLKREDRPMRATDATMERIDNSKGYVKGNVILVASYFNNLKACYENPTSVIEFSHLKKFIDTLDRLR